MTANLFAPKSAIGIWQRIWLFLQAMEMSSADFQDLRADALERRIAELENERRARASVPTDALPKPGQDHS